MLSLFDTNFLTWSVQRFMKWSWNLSQILKMYFVLLESASLTCDSLYIVHTFSLCTHLGHLKRPPFACRGLLNGRLWEVVVLPQGRPCSTHAGVCYATAITVEDKMFQVDVWKCYLGFVLSVGGWWWRWWLVTFAFRNIWQVFSVALALCEYYIKVFLCAFETQLYLFRKSLWAHCISYILIICKLLILVWF